MSPYILVLLLRLPASASPLDAPSLGEVGPRASSGRVSRSRAYEVAV
jgi:hypothetical protein